MTDQSSRIIPPGGAIGILGGGQLGRMTALAAARLGYRCHVFCPEVGSPAADVAQNATFADYGDRRALAAFAKAVDVVTIEFENIPVDTIAYLMQRVPVRPGVLALETAQDRIREKSFFNRIGAATAPWHAVETERDLKEAAERIGRRAILKTARLGYDGKGQVRLGPGTDLSDAWDSVGKHPCILEGLVDFTREVSVIIARAENGAWAAYEPVENTHADGILATTRAPAPLDRAQGEAAVSLARTIAESLELTGLLAVEMFQTADGNLLVNEMAPRPHNSGHWTIDACFTDQFEQLVRAVCGLPLGSTERHSDAQMTNLIGADVERWREYLEEPRTRLHLYGKREARPGRKMGHVTRLTPRRG